MIIITDKKNCCGCAACAEACPKYCITMRADQEGFLYPVVDKHACVGCNLCESVCPIINCQPEIQFDQKAYLVQNKDESVRRESTSGGAFTAIAQFVIAQGGVVFGVAYDEKFHVHHMYVTEINELWRFRNSKYVQSDTGETFSQAENFLKEGRLVCYSGTPCQIEGLKRYLRKDYENLITVDVVCHAVPSPFVWKKYVEMQQGRFGTDISNIIFRDKHYGYQYSTMTIKDKNGKEIYAYGIDTDPMLRAFFSNICDRPSCYNCLFKKRYRVSDFTLWDCFEVDKLERRMNDDKGTTRVLIHSKKGKDVFSELVDYMMVTEVDSNKLVAGVKEMFQSVKMNLDRKQFFDDLEELSGNKLFEKYFPENVRVKLERTIRIVCYQSGMYAVMKKVGRKLMKNRRY